LPEKLITVLTATYNRAHLLPDLYRSLCRQTCQAFDWVIVDDGSTDGTETLVHQWSASSPSFSIHYIRKNHEGKNLAINHAVRLASTPFSMIVDSDDYLTDYAIAFLSAAAAGIMDTPGIAGVAGKRGEQPDDLPNLSVDSFILANNLERRRYHLEKDANEVYKTGLLRSHPFDVWPGETFVPEEIVWNDLALEGYSLRWYDLTTCIVRYQDGGLTRGAWALLKNNPMGYAKMYNQRIALHPSLPSRFRNTLLFVSCCLLGNNPQYFFQCNNRMLALLLFIPGWLLSLRRKCQFAKYSNPYR